MSSASPGHETSTGLLSLDDIFKTAILLDGAAAGALEATNVASYLEASVEIGDAIKCPGLKVRLEPWEVLYGSPLVKYCTILQLPSIWSSLKLRLAPAFLNFWLYGKFSVHGVAAATGFREAKEARIRDNIPLVLIESQWITKGKVGEIVKTQVASKRLELAQTVNSPNKIKDLLTNSKDGHPSAWTTVAAKKAKPGQKCKFGHATWLEGATVKVGTVTIRYLDYLRETDFNTPDPDFECLAALGGFGIQCYCSGELERRDAATIRVTIDSFAWRILDKYNFTDHDKSYERYVSQPLGLWSKRGFTIDGTYLDNASFQELRTSGMPLINTYLAQNRDRCRESHTLICRDFTIVSRQVVEPLNPVLTCDIPV